MRTTVNIDDELLSRARTTAVTTGRSLGDIVNDALRVLLIDRHTPAGARVVLPVSGGSGTQPGVDPDDKEALAELLGDNAGPSHADR
jgi:hypothetical protein